jgi:D-glycero-D-manno-heptose 1,7-bisphosphate phosphatase
MFDAIFLDRDGVVNKETNYLSDPDQLVLVPGSAEAVRLFNELNIPVVVVTNQAGVARGLYKEAQVEVLHQALSALLAKGGAHVDRYYYCPHHPEGEGEYRKVCECRKPQPGLLRLAAKEMNLDLSRCALVGDKASDIGAAVACDLAQAVLVLTGHGTKEWDAWSEAFRPSYVASDLLEASKWLLR